MSAKWAIEWICTNITHYGNMLAKEMDRYENIGQMDV